MNGVQCIDESGFVYFDSSQRQYYQLVGKLTAKWNSAGAEWYIVIPAKYVTKNLLIGIKAPTKLDFRGSPFGMGLTYSMFGSSLRVVISWTGAEQINVRVPVGEIYLYTLDDVPLNKGAYGIYCKNAAGVDTFTSESASTVLQVTSIYSLRDGYSAKNLGVRDKMIIIHAQPAVRNNPTPGYASISGASFYQLGDNTHYRIGVIGDGSFPGSFAKKAISLSFAKLPGVVKTIPW